jgi:hypothetical protein
VDLDLAQLSRAVGHEVTAYTVEAIDPQLRFHSVTGGVYRVRGEGFSLIIKIVRQGTDGDTNGLWVSGAEVSHRNYWKREWIAYQSGLLDGLPGELRAPRTMLCTEVSDTECWIWMEDVEGRPGAQWSVDDYDSAAFDLATTQSAYPAGRAMMPPDPWLSHHWLREWVGVVEQQIGALEDDSAWQEPSITALAALRPRVRALWSAREQLLEIVEAAPQTVVHLDLWPTNLIAADDGTTVAIDWSQVGIGAIAQDLDQLTLDPVWMQVVPDASLNELEMHVLPSYVSGLRLSGLEVDPDDVRRWYAAAASVHYAPLLSSPTISATDSDHIETSERRFGLPYTAIIANKARVIERALELGEWVLDTA